jgi:hypothetical protein
MHLTPTIYAVGFVQNTMTTGLIVYRIWRQDRQSRGIISSSLKLIVIVRIIVESASIYLLNILILIILYALNSTGQLLALESIVPVCGEFRHVNVLNNYQIFMLHPGCQGIVFTLITVRLSLHTSTALATTQHPGTQIQFASFPGMAIDSTGCVTTTSSSTDSSEQVGRIDGHASVSGDWGHVNEAKDNASDSADVPSEDVLGDGKLEMECDTLSGVAA